MAYRISNSDYSTASGPPDPAAWVGPPGPMGPPGPQGIPGPLPAGGPFLQLTGGTVTGDVHVTTNIDADTGLFAGIAYPGQRAGGAARTWVGQSDNGSMTYYDTQSLAAFTPPPAYAIGLAASVRSSDRLFGSGTANIAIATFAKSDSTDVNAGPTWGFYGSARRLPGGTTTFGAEFSVGNLGNTPDLNPYQIFTNPGNTIGLWLSSGSEAAGAGETVNPAACALVIGTNGSTWAKGIVFEATGLYVGGTHATMLAMQLPTKAEMQWIANSGGVRSAFIRSDATTPNTGVGILFDNTKLNVVSVVNETNVFSVNTVGLVTANGISMPGSPANVSDLTDGISFLATGQCGLNGYGNQLNLNVPTGQSFNFVIAGSSIGFINATGMNYIPIGASGPAAGSFTTLAATGAVSGSGFSNYLASPPAIGGTVAAAGTFTSVNLNALGGGIHLTGVTGSSGSDVTKHIELYAGAGYGFGVTGGFLNYVAGAGAVHAYYIGTTQVATISATGIAIGAAGAAKVLGAQITGWGTPTGPSRVANFPGASATLVQCSNAIAQIIADLKTHGMLGA